MLISFILPIYIFNKRLFQSFRMTALLMFMTNMFIVQKLDTLYNSHSHIDRLMNNTYFLLEEQNQRLLSY